jgi:ATP-dependent RNA helicase RhlE
MPFHRLKLIEPLLRAVRSEGYDIPTAIQEHAIPYVLEGRDLLGCAQTGTGKTAAFALPILQRLYGHSASAESGAQVSAAKRRRGASAVDRPIRALVITPTRELAAQIGESFRVYGAHTALQHAVIFGGVSQFHQEKALRKGVDILVATPGRLLDLLNQKVLALRGVEVLVLDEADRMLDMGFIQDIRRIIAQIPQKRQTLMFSATMPKEIRAMAGQILTNPVEIRVPADSPAADTVQQTLYYVDQNSKLDLLGHLLKDEEITRALVFTRTKHGADREAIHSNKSQNVRTRTLANFKQGRTRVLVASDIASRGLDVDDISHVVNFDLPHEPETYVHRIGRTGRAGAQGRAISFCSGEQRGDLREIERLLGRAIPVLEHAIASRPGAEPKPARTKRAAGRSHAKTPSPEQQRDQFWKRRNAAKRGGAGRRRGR